ncbi:CDP-glycerol glycerophosphotransferase family protein [Microterricola pindariensis]|uniref:CDP-glycerol--glycerophosphate glycerophosphotransferase n=1 Tax=Microterricola pindariensis TaxID=478010 RepID=A0ABX5AU15_9MICO|nr:CDP-glycerol glycerophosphotransferase family protein [Microterricola pindariensis]PPL17336.1 hypothetical protein GY24_11600 [Microterricola pindariensis]
MGIQKDMRNAIKLVKGVLASRKAQGQLREKLAVQGPLEPHRFKVGVYFADGKVNMYQMRQWYKPLAKLAETWPVLILSRASGAAITMLDEAPVPVAYVRKVVDLERVIHEQDLRVIFYVNQNAKNFQMMRYGRRWHVFINHGESDKMYMTTNQFKAYDYSLIAGDAARARLGKVLWDYDFDKRALPIGRPQADHYLDDAALPYQQDSREVVLYAPTWEGDRGGAAYGSIATHGVALIARLLASPRHRVIYRPHPRSGVLDPAYAAANREIVRMIEAANAADATAQHVFDTGSQLGWQLVASDVAIVDISAMVYDRLAAGKPLLVTRPANPAAEIDTSGYLSDCEWLPAADADNIVAIVDELTHGDAAQARLRRWVEYYFGDTTPGSATRRFHGAVQHLMEEWDKHAAIHAADAEFDDHDVKGDIEDAEEIEA